MPTAKTKASMLAHSLGNPFDLDVVIALISGNDLAQFKQEADVIVANRMTADYDLCFPVIDLYRNCIEHLDTMAQAA